MWLDLATSGSSPLFRNLYVSSAVTASQVSASFIGDGAQISGIVTSSFSETSSYFRESKIFGITIDGGGSAITTGVKGDITIPFACTIDSWYITADQAGSIVIDVWKDAFANFPPTVADTIAGSEKPTLSAASSNSDTNLTSFTKSIASNDVIRFNVDSAATVTRVNLVFRAYI